MSELNNVFDKLLTVLTRMDQEIRDIREFVQSSTAESEKVKRLEEQIRYNDKVMGEALDDERKKVQKLRDGYTRLNQFKEIDVNGEYTTTAPMFDAYEANDLARRMLYETK